LNLNSNGPLPQITGTIAGSGWVSSDLMADRATNNNNVATAYTMLIAPDPTVAAAPGGYGYALITGSKGTSKLAASAKIAGVLADGTAFSESAPVSSDGFVPVYANLYSSKGLLLGWINIDPTNTTSSSLSWVHPASKGLFTSTFASTNQVFLSPWTNPPAPSSLPTNLIVIEPSASPPITESYAFDISKGTTITSTSSNSAGPLKGTITTKTGLVKMTIGSGKNVITGTGVLLLDSTNGGGYLLNKTTSGAVIFTP
jgi:hypothetical protein